MMKAFAVKEFGCAKNLQIVTLPKPTPGARDLLVKVHAVATNPVDYKLRSAWGTNTGTADPPAIQGFDGSGVVEAVGGEVKKFKAGDEVFFAGYFQRPGCNAEFVLVDERITASKPKKLSHEESAAMPLTSLTAYEGLVGMGLAPGENSGKTILIVGGAGGVGSICIQIAKKVFGLKVVATASRPETVEWCKKMGADHIINHRKVLKEELTALGIEGVDFLFNCVNANSNWDATTDCVFPHGKMTLITGLDNIDMKKVWFKRITVYPEIMFSVPMFMGDSENWSQSDILFKVSELLDSGELQTTKNKTFKWCDLIQAHEEQESGASIGKQVSTVEW